MLGASIRTVNMKSLCVLISVVTFVLVALSGCGRKDSSPLDRAAPIVAPVVVQSPALIAAREMKSELEEFYAGRRRLDDELAMAATVWAMDVMGRARAVRGVQIKKVDEGTTVVGGAQHAVVVVTFELSFGSGATECVQQGQVVGTDRYGTRLMVQCNDSERKMQAWRAEYFGPKRAE
jgi:hypothetical protein